MENSTVSHVFILVATTRIIHKNIADTGTGQICNSVEILKREVHTCINPKPRFIYEKY